METRAVREERRVAGWLINGEKMWTTGMHVATHVMSSPAPAAMTATRAASPCFLVPAGDPA